MIIWEPNSPTGFAGLDATDAPLPPRSARAVLGMLLAVGLVVGGMVVAVGEVWR